MLVENDDSRPYIGRDSIGESVAEAGRVSESRAARVRRAALPRRGAGGVWPIDLDNCFTQDKMPRNFTCLGPYRLVVKSSRCGLYTSP